jgi:hypothetical protein
VYWMQRHAAGAEPPVLRTFAARRRSNCPLLSARPPPPSEIWDALRAAATSDDPLLAKAILEAAEVKVRLRGGTQLMYIQGQRHHLPPSQPQNLKT